MTRGKLKGPFKTRHFTIRSPMEGGKRTVDYWEGQTLELVYNMGKDRVETGSYRSPKYPAESFDFRAVHSSPPNYWMGLLDDKRAVRGCITTDLTKVKILHLRREWYQGLLREKEDEIYDEGDWEGIP